MLYLETVGGEFPGHTERSGVRKARRTVLLKPLAKVRRSCNVVVDDGLG